MSNYKRLGSLEKVVAKLFIFCFPFKMFAPIYFLNSITFGLASTASFLFCALGLLCIVLKGKIILVKDDGNKLFSHFAFMYILCDITSLIMAVILHNEAGVIAGETTFVAVPKKILFTLAYILFVFYAKEIAKILSKEEVSQVLDASLVVCIVIGFIQVFHLVGVSFAGKIYDGINVFFNAWSSSNITRTQRIALLANEPAYSAGFITSIAIPYLLSKIATSSKQIKNIIKVFLFVILLFYTKSTTGYFLLLVDIFVFSIVCYRFGNNKQFLSRIIIFFLAVLCVTSFVVLIFGSEMFSNTVLGVMDKAFSFDNPTSADRKGTIAVGFSLLFKYPIMGVGNGNQGFFYREMLPAWAREAYTGQDAYNRASTELFDGGPFWLSFLSGYGLVGIILLVLFFKNCFKVMKDHRDVLGYVYVFYFMSIITLFVNGLISSLDSKYYFWFVLSIPMMTSYWNSNKDFHNSL